MKLTIEQSRKILEDRGTYVTEACDQCGQLLGHIRFTVKDQPDEWCSRACREGKAAHSPGACLGCGATLNGKRKGALFCDGACRKASKRNLTGKIARAKALIGAHFEEVKTASAPLSPVLQSGTLESAAIQNV